MSAPVHYDIAVHDAHAHLWRVTLTIKRPSVRQRVSLPVWIPGSYMVREFSKHLQNLQVRQSGTQLPATQIDKCTWLVDCKVGLPLGLSYEVYAFDNSVRSAWLTPDRGFFNPSSLCLRVEGMEAMRHTLSLATPEIKALRTVSTSARHLQSTKMKPSECLGHFEFQDLDELMDTPFALGESWRGRFNARGVDHEFVVSGAAPGFDGKRLLADTKRAVESCIAFWHGKEGQPPFDRYVFMLNAVDDGYGGLEHRNSTALICARRDLPRVGISKPTDGYITLLGLISHEYFHTWNVKRLKPKEFLRYDYARENYTQMLWFFEGFTSYYDDLLLLRAGLIDQKQFLRLLTKTVNQVQQTPGRALQSAAQASMDAWVKYYRQDENTPNATVSYYNKGALIALCFDLSLRYATSGSKPSSLDEVMRWLWKRSKAAQMGGGGITETDFARALRALSGRSYTDEIAAWVHGRADLPIPKLLELHGVAAQPDAAALIPLAQRLGLRVSEANGSVKIKMVLRGGAAEAAGMAAGDEWLAVDDWRISKLEDLDWLATQPLKVTALVSRDKRLLRLKLRMPSPDQEPTSSYNLRIVNEEAVRAWLLG